MSTRKSVIKSRMTKQILTMNCPKVVLLIIWTAFSTVYFICSYNAFAANISIYHEAFIVRVLQFLLLFSVTEASKATQKLWPLVDRIYQFIFSASIFICPFINI